MRVEVEENPLPPTRMDIVSTIVQNGDIVELDQNIRKMVSTADVVTLVSSFTIIGIEHTNHWCIKCLIIYTILFSY